MIFLSLYFIGFAIAFFLQWHLPEGPKWHGGEFGAAFAVALIWPIILLIIVGRYLVSIMGLEL